MKGLLDTHTFYWWYNDPSKLSAPALAFILDPASEILLIVVSVWEIVIKTQVSKFALKIPLSKLLTEQQANGVQLLPVTLDHVLDVENLPTVHKDPFDRLLIAQARVELAELVSADAVFAQYPVKVLW